jgi:hypothetical protein
MSRNLARRLFEAEGVKVAFVNKKFPDFPANTVILTDWDLYFSGETPMLSNFDH